MVCNQQKDIRVELNLSKRHCTGPRGRTRLRALFRQLVRKTFSKGNAVPYDHSGIAVAIGPMMPVSVETPSISLFTEMNNGQKRKEDALH